MTIEHVTMYRVVCDEPDCGISTPDLGDFTAWDEDRAAVDQWEDVEGLAVGGKHFCPFHAPAHLCDYCGNEYEQRVEGRCAQCRIALDRECEFLGARTSDGAGFCSVHGGAMSGDSAAVCREIEILRS